MKKCKDLTVRKHSWTRRWGMHPHRPALTLGLKHPIVHHHLASFPTKKQCQHAGTKHEQLLFSHSPLPSCAEPPIHITEEVCRPFLGTEKSIFFCMHHFNEHWTQKSFIQKSPVYQKYCFACRCFERIKMLDRLWKNNPAWMPSHHITTICFWPLTESFLWFGFHLYNRDTVGLRCEILLPDLCVYL